LANRDSRSSVLDFLLACASAASTGIEFVVAYDYARVKASIRKVLPEAACQRCLRALLNERARLDLAEARAEFAAWIGTWQNKYLRLSRLGLGKQRARRSLSTACRASTSTSRAPTCWSG
jgi:hypothetical protein